MCFFLIASLSPHIFWQPFTFSLKWEQCHSAALFPSCSSSSSQWPPWPSKVQLCDAVGMFCRGKRRCFLEWGWWQHCLGHSLWTADVTFFHSTLCSSAMLLIAAYSFPWMSHFRTSYPHYPDLLVSRPKLAVLVLGTMAGVLLEVKVAMCTSGGPQGSQHGDLQCR